MWLHLGSFGPKRLVTGDPVTTAAVPFPLVDNAETLLDVSDLVFVDAVGTGLSEAIAPNVNQTFWSVDTDAAVFRDFVVRYQTVNNRKASPLFLFGESYGTTRSAVLVYLLESAGVRVNGVVLQSSVLNYNTNCGVVTDAKVSCAGYVPSYGAIGAYYNLDVPNPADALLPDFVAQVRTLTTSGYAPALAQFFALGTAPSNALLTQLSNATGVSVQKWQGNFNLGPGFLSGATAPRGADRTLRCTGLRALGQRAGTRRRSIPDVRQCFLRHDDRQLSDQRLQYTNPSTYVASSNAIQTWNFAHDGLPLPDVIPDLAAAMAQNPKLQILAANGYHDLATPFFQTELDLARLGASPNVSTTFYRGGHMIYLDDRSRPLEKADVVQLIQRTTAAP